MCSPDPNIEGQGNVSLYIGPIVKCQFKERALLFSYLGSRNVLGYTSGNGTFEESRIVWSQGQTQVN